jgi:hypothetical protein
MEQFKKALAELVAEIDKSQTYKLPLIVFVDELDRCRPLYAIELLEEIKHLFDAHGVCFVVATDTRQLCSSIKAVYGAEFDAERYLHRFFSQDYTLPDPDYYSFSQMLCSELPEEISQKLFLPFSVPNGMEKLPYLFGQLANAFELDLRSQQQCFLLFEALSITWDQGKIHAPLLIYLIMLRQRSRSAFDGYLKRNEQVPSLEKSGFGLINTGEFSVNMLSHDGFSIKAISLSNLDLLRTYIDIAMQQAQGTFLETFRRGTRNLNNMEEELYRHIAHSYTTATPLSDYPHLVQRAGQSFQRMQLVANH